MSKELIKKMLEALTPDELKELLGEVSDEDDDEDVEVLPGLDPDEEKELIEATKFDRQIRKKGLVVPKIPRGNPFVDVKCRVCGREERVSKKLVRGDRTYKCNSCSCRPG